MGSGSQVACKLRFTNLTITHTQRDLGSVSPSGWNKNFNLIRVMGLIKEPEAEPALHNHLITQVEFVVEFVLPERNSLLPQ